jgi:hypothetical protein
MAAILLFLAAVVLAVWSALVDAGHVDVGSAFQLLALSVACFAAAFLLEHFSPWWQGRR